MKIDDVISQIKPLDEGAMEKARERQDSLTKPQGSLGFLEELSIRIAGIKADPLPKINEKVIITMAGDHGVTDEGVSAYPKEVTPQMVLNFLGGGAGINVIARHVDARVVVVDMGVAGDIPAHQNLISKKVAPGTKNMTKAPAMTKDEAVQAVITGIEIAEREIQEGADIIGTGDMGIGNTTPSSAIAAVFTGAEVRDLTGRGTGINDEALENKIKIIEKAIEVNSPDPEDPLDVLAKVGGFEIGGLAGVILAGANNRVPVVIDGFISGAAALIATEMAPLAKDYIIASHESVEAGHKIMLAHMGLRPVLDLDLRLGEGTGAALGIGLAETSVKILSEMATFEEASVSNKK
jgi:nicotinate-nucleotide--dimethylbenzimidazole phosphoribosyltransferase